MQNFSQNYNIESLFQGDQQGRGVLINNHNGDKKAYFENRPIDWKLHLKGEKIAYWTTIEDYVLKKHAFDVHSPEYQFLIK